MHPGWPRFQPVAGEYLAAALRGNETPGAVVAGLARLAVRHRLGDDVHPVVDFKSIHR